MGISTELFSGFLATVERFSRGFLLLKICMSSLQIHPQDRPDLARWCSTSPPSQRDLSASFMPLTGGRRGALLNHTPGFSQHHKHVPSSKPPNMFAEGGSEQSNSDVLLRAENLLYSMVCTGACVTDPDLLGCAHVEVFLFSLLSTL